MIYQTQTNFDQEYGYTNAYHVSYCTKFRKSITFTKAQLWEKLICLFPILRWFPNYKWKRYIATDIIAGTVIAIMHIPQSMAYAELAGLRPQYGLYTSFWPTLIYAFVGTSRHISLGTLAIVSVMSGEVCHKFVTKPHNIDAFNQTSSDDNEINVYKPIEIATTLTFTIGIVQFLFGFCRIGFITTYLSDQVISGFTTGAAIHVLTAQINKLINVKLPRHNGMAQVFKSWYDIVYQVPNTNWVTMLISLVTCITIYISKEYINPPIKKKYKVPIPFDLIIVIIGILLSANLDLSTSNDVQIVGHIPHGFPLPELPRFKLIPHLLPDALSLSIIIYVITYSLGRTFAERHCYKIDATQEWYALGFVELTGSFMHCYPSGASLSRSSVFESTGAKSLLANFVTCAFLAVIIVFAGPLFHTLPMCILASIILVSLKGLLLQIFDLRKLWPVSKLDAMIWIVSCISTIVLDVKFGLLISIIFALLTNVIRSQFVTSESLVQCETGKYVNLQRYEKINAKPLPNLKIIRFNGPLQFTNVDIFRSAIYRNADIDYESIKANIQHMKTNEMLEFKKINENLHDLNVSGHLLKNINIQDKETTIMFEREKQELPIYLILDCKSIYYIDFMGITTLLKMTKELKHIRIDFLLANIPDQTKDTLNSCASFKAEFNDQHIFPSLDDAISYVQVNLERNKL